MLLLGHKTIYYFIQYATGIAVVALHGSGTTEQENSKSAAGH